VEEDLPKELNPFPVILLAPKENPDDPAAAVPPNVDCPTGACGVVEGFDASKLNPNADGPGVEAGVVVVGPKENVALEASAPEAGGVANENEGAFGASPGFEVDPNAAEARFPPNTFDDPKGDEAVRRSDAGFCVSWFEDVTPNPEVAPNVDDVVAPKADLAGTVFVAPGVAGADIEAPVNEKAPGFCAPLEVVASVVDEGGPKPNIDFAGAGAVAAAAVAPKPEKTDLRAASEAGGAGVDNLVMIGVLAVVDGPKLNFGALVPELTGFAVTLLVSDGGLNPMAGAEEAGLISAPPVPLENSDGAAAAGFPKLNFRPSDGAVPAMIAPPCDVV